MSAGPQIDEASGVVASIARIEAWLSIATAGDEFVYATRAALPPGSKSAAHLRELAGRGAVELFQRGTTEAGVRNYVARRTACPLGVKPPIARTPVVDDSAFDEMEDRLLAHLRAAVRRGLPCPPDAALARAMELPRQSDVARLYERLRQAGTITVEVVRDIPTYRVVTLTETGQRTLAPGPTR